MHSVYIEGKLLADREMMLCAIGESCIPFAPRGSWKLDETDSRGESIKEDAMKGILTLLAMLVAIDDSRDYAVNEHVDLIEINHYFDESGKSVFDQLIFYDWSSEANRYNVLAWRLIKSPHQVPIRQARGRGYHCVWHEGKVLRVITADRILESWTQYDPETAERAHLPKEQRPDLFKPLSKRK